VTGGTFDRGNSPAASATVSDFKLGRFEVTVARFRRFVTASLGGYQPKAGDGKHSHLKGGGIADEKGWDTAWSPQLPQSQSEWNKSLGCNGAPADAPYLTWTPTPGANEQRPINCVSWYEAFAFCAYDGGFLPTEAEWNYAAAGGNEQRLHPWGAAAPDFLKASFNCNGDTQAGCALADIREVGSYPGGDGRWQHADLAGNVHEIVIDRYGAYPTPCQDCALLSGAEFITLRGGAFTSLPQDLEASFRKGRAIAGRDALAGFRCAYAP
jgi:formylglycine-generating enzyme required for sulfatase activity